MNKMTVVSLLLAGLLGISAVAAADEPETPDDLSWGNAPDFAMTSTHGDEQLLSDYAGKPIVLNFWAEWCPPCVAELPLLESAWEEYGDDVQFLTVNLEKGRQDPAAFLAERELDLPAALAANEVGAQYGIRGIPATFFISSGGDVLAVKTGAFAEGELPWILDAFLDFEQRRLADPNAAPPGSAPPASDDAEADSPASPESPANDTEPE